MKKNTMMRIASVLLIAVLMTTCVISGTFAKYTSTFTSEESAATVAKWAFTVGTDDTEVVGDFTFDLFATIKEEDTTTAETDVDSNKIAPGTGGSFAIELTNASEVNATYKLQLAEENDDEIPIKYSIDKSSWYNLSDFNEEMNDTAINMDTTSTTITVYWKWVYVATDGRTDTDDTLLGEAATAPTVTTTATVTITQKD